MHPEFHRQLAQARIADLHRQAERDALVRATRRARRARRYEPEHPARAFRPVAIRRVLAILGSWSA
jgi:hypothetical protein